MPGLFKQFFIIILCTFLLNGLAHGQSLPKISYPSPITLNLNKSFTSIVPQNTGGVAYPANYLAPQIFVNYNTPFSIASDNENNIYTSNNTTGEVSKYSPSGLLLLTIKTGSSQASEVAVDANGNIYVSQFTENKVLKYNSSGNIICSIDGFRDPYGIAFDSKSNAYVSNLEDGSISKIAANDTTATNYLNGFKTPYGLVFDKNDNLFVTEQSVGELIKVDAKTFARTVFATGFNGPRHLSKDKFDNIYVADYGNGQIVKVDQEMNKTPILVNLNSPRQCIIDNSGAVLFADFGTNNLKKSPATAFSIDTPLPDGLTFDQLTGEISGIPVKASILKNYKVTAYNTVGKASFLLSLSVDTLSVKPSLPALSIRPATAISANSATLNGIVNADIKDATISFEYSLSSDFSTSIKTTSIIQTSVNGQYPKKDSLAITNLQPATKYFYFMKASGALSTIYSDTLEFMTAVAPKSNDSNLALLSTGLLKLSPLFSPGITDYHVAIADTVTTLPIMAIPHDTGARIVINNDTLVNSGSSGSSIVVKQINTLTKVSIIVIAPDGSTKKTYTINLDKIKVTPPKSNDSNLALLSTGLLKLSPLFSPGITDYHVAIADTVTTLPIMAIPHDTGARIVINNDTLVNSGSSGSSIVVKQINTLTKVSIIIIAPDGSTKKTYTINLDKIKVTPPKSNDSNLALLSTGLLKLSPLFSPGITDYHVAIADTVTTLPIMAIPHDTGARIVINNDTLVNSGSSGSSIVVKQINTLTKVSIIVIAPDGSTKKTYTINLDKIKVTPPKSNDSNLASLSTGLLKLSPLFSPGITDYHVAIADTVTTLPIMAIPHDTGARIVINNDTLVNSGSSGSSIVVKQINTLTKVSIIVIAPDGSTKKTYTINLDKIKVTPPKSNDSNLALLSTGLLKLSPLFSPGITDYHVAIADTVTTLPIMAIPHDTGARIVINNDTLVNSGSSGSSIVVKQINTLTKVSIIIIAPDGSTKKTYTINLDKIKVTPPKSNDSNLALLSTGLLKLSPLFSPGITDYHVAIADTVTTLPIMAIPHDTGARIVINNDTLVNSGSSGSSIVVKQINTLTKVSIIVIAPDGSTKKTYTINLDKIKVTPPKSNDSNLALLSTGLLKLSPLFSPGITDYHVAIADTVTTLPIMAIPHDTGARIVINNDTLVNSGSSGSSIVVKQINTLTKVSIIIIAPDGSTKKTYTINLDKIKVTPPKSNDSNLASLSTGLLKLSPLFSPGITDYHVAIADTVTTLPIMAIPHDTGARIVINNDTLVNSGSSGSSIVVKQINTLTKVSIIVIAPDGSTKKTYTINLDKIKVTPPKSNDSNLALLSTGLLKLSPLFSPGITDYHVAIADTVTTLPIMAIPHDTGARIVINNDTLVNSGSSGSSIVVKQINTLTKVSIIVIAPDGSTKKTYTINLDKIKVTPPKSNDSNLALLSTGLLKLSPLFSPGITDYHVAIADTVTTLPIMAIPHDTGANVKINDNDLTSRSSSTFIKIANGTTKINVVVTAADGLTKKIYSINVDRFKSPADTLNSGPDSTKETSPKSNNNILASLSTRESELNPDFSPDIQTYNITVSPTTSDLSIFAKPADSKAKVSINGIANKDFNSPIVINLKNTTTITVVVVAPDGVSRRVYTLNIIPTVNTNLPPDDNTESGHSGGSPESGELGSNNNQPSSPNNESQGNSSSSNSKPQSTDMEEIFIHQAVSPNGDGKNDSFQIEGLQKYPDNKVTILNVNGVKIFETKGYNNSSNCFDGRSNLTGALLRQGTYYYQVEYRENQQTKRKLGYLVLKY